MNKPLKNLIIWFHIIEIMLVWFTPFLLSWYLILIGILLNYLQMAVVGDCILTRMQFGKRNKKAFYTFILEKLGFKPNNEKVNFFVIHIKPIILLAVSSIWQLVLGNRPLIV